MHVNIAVAGPSHSDEHCLVQMANQAWLNLEQAPMLIMIATLYSNPVRASEDDEEGIVLDWCEWVAVGCEGQI